MLMQIHPSTKSKNEEGFILPRLIRRGCTKPYLSAKGLELGPTTPNRRPLRAVLNVPGEQLVELFAGSCLQPH